MKNGLLKGGLEKGPFSKEQLTPLDTSLKGLNSDQLQWLAGFLTSFSEMKRENKTESKSGDPVWVLYGTQTGNSERLAKLTAERLDGLGIANMLCNMGSFNHRELRKIKRLLVIVSTQGLGEPPIEAESFHNYLHGKRAPSLKHLEYSVLALGDSSYADFCQTGKDFDRVLERLGGKRLFERVDCDVDFEDGHEEWLGGVLNEVSQSNALSTDIEVKDTVGSFKIEPSGYDRKTPYEAEVLQKINLNGRNSSKETLHIELDLGESSLQYQPGDALGVYAHNPDELIVEVLGTLGLTGSERIKSHHGEKTLHEALKTDYELTPLTGANVIRYAKLTKDPRLEKMVDDNMELMEYLRGRDILDMIRETPFKMSAETFITLLRKNSSRLYSIASSSEVYGNEVHILVSTVRYEAHGRSRGGHCSTYMADRVQEGDRISVFVEHNSRFKPPVELDVPMIMVGAGTGVAPYRSFIQQRQSDTAHGKTWLFFGDRNFSTDFLYQTEWLEYLKNGILARADVAFSRDQEEKVYVQDRLMEKGKEVYQWLEDGAHFYVCGDAQKMAKDVNHALRSIIMLHGGMTEEKAKEYMDYLRAADRYQTDVY
ncbi:assimilatory sulfite reductase (NADPH) flavoprotein subunit [Allomuricauda sp. CP2A]|jgi:sulfite reductase (NADPH) flavoprotein alpha-component|uniref:assimilatory sulfite reductase (NADPH) flavoprotein subunit n=1 Tax=Allomuricauda sp. CP2A TaxID=1848189 RepID=UPI00082E269C|nr:assimilatory sulfite reductase (NADPH) flavoprotein subunit [Muricauda sp. CP2A]